MYFKLTITCELPPRSASTPRSLFDAAALDELADEEEIQAASAAEAAKAAAAATQSRADFEGDEDTEAVRGAPWCNAASLQWVTCRAQAAKDLIGKLADPDFQAALDEAMGSMKSSNIPDGQGGATVDAAPGLDGDELDATLKATMEVRPTPPNVCTTQHCHPNSTHR